MKKKLFSILALLCMAVTGAWAEDGTTTVTDVLDNDWTGVTGTNYQEITGLTASSDAVYTIQCAGGNSSIQMRSNNSNSGIVTTESGGKVKSVKIEWNADTNDARVLEVYGKSEAYSAASDLYGDAQGTKIASFAKTDGDQTITIDGDYEFIGMRSKSGALYINKITIVWEAPATVGGGTLSDEEFELTSVANEYGTISFTNAAGETITKAQEGDVVTVTVTPDDEHEAAGVTGEWYAAIAAARVADEGTFVDLLTDIEFTPVEDTDNQWTFTMQRANAEVSASFWDLKDIIEMLREQVELAKVVFKKYGDTKDDEMLEQMFHTVGTSIILLMKYDKGLEVSLQEAYELYKALKKFNALFAEDIATGIKNVNVNENENENRYYDLNGRKVMNPTKGIYILNGKKVVIR